MRLASVRRFARSVSKYGLDGSRATSQTCQGPQSRMVLATTDSCEMATSLKVSRFSAARGAASKTPSSSRTAMRVPRGLLASSAVRVGTASSRALSGQVGRRASANRTVVRCAAGADITERELADARKIWGDALVAVSKAYEDDGLEAATKVANSALDAAYGYNLGDVLFKPTLASGDHTFRPTREGALSYFVGGNEKYPLDRGFGIKGWRKVESETAATFIQGDIGMWMGWVTFTNKDGSITKVDKSWCYKKDNEGKLRIVLHHSSLPYDPEQKAEAEAQESQPEACKERWEALVSAVKGFFK
mmetsp:Transcript_3342/g.12096  ORF Transcript_3342/g.12096 Transcript_3342/m.12096 type:complete len:304 (+) Transcript_3342:1-912(+)